VTEVGPETPTSTWTLDRRAGFWTRRLTHETVVHRADAALATGTPYDVDAELAADDPRIRVSGDAALFRHWLAHTRFQAGLTAGI